MAASPKTNARSARLSVLLGLAVGCQERPPPSWPAPEPAAKPPPAVPVVGSPEGSATQGVPPGALDIPDGGCPATAGDPDPLCAAARALPVTLTRIPTKLGGLLPLPGGKVHNQSSRDIYAIGSVPDAPGVGPWEIVRIPSGVTLGGELGGGSTQTTTDVDWVAAAPPAPDGRGGFTYGPLAVGVKVFDGGDLTVVDRPGGGVRFWLSAAGSLASTITSAGQMNGGSAIVYVPRR